jgi:hypothetical protein
MEELDALLDFIEGHIDEEHIRRTERLHLDAMAYLPVPHLPLAVVFSTCPSRNSGAAPYAALRSW